MYMYTHKFTHVHTLTHAGLLDIISMVCGMVAVYTYIYSLSHTHTHTRIRIHAHTLHTHQEYLVQAVRAGGGLLLDPALLKNEDDLAGWEIRPVPTTQTNTLIL